MDDARRKAVEDALFELAIGGQTLTTAEQVTTQAEIVNGEEVLTGANRKVDRVTTLPDKDLLMFLCADSQPSIGGPQDYC